MITQQQLEQRLLAACNCLRGPVDPTDYKAYIFPLLFLKRISDYWDWEYFRALEAFGGDEDLARLEDNYRFVLPEADLQKSLPGCHWENVRDLQENVGVGLQTILQRIELANSDTLAGIFGDVQWANKEKLPEHTLLNVIEEFSTLDLSPDNAPGDILGAAYEYLLKYFADESGKKAGEFFTPRSVVRLLTLILDPEEGESVHDPTCGSGGMLVEMANVVREHGGDARTLRLSGQEVSLTTAAIARMNLFLHDIEDFRIRRGDTLREPRFKTATGQLEQFDIVIANPPFSLSPWGRELWAGDLYGRSHYGVPPADYGDWAFVEHMLALMKPEKARMGVVLSHGALFRGRSERSIRQRVIEDGLLEGVIGLPPRIFYNTDLLAHILVFRQVGDPPDAVTVVDGSGKYEAAAKGNAMTVENVASIVRAYEAAARGEEVESLADDEIPYRKVPVDEVESNDWDLTISRYVRRVSAGALDLDTAVSVSSESEEQLGAAHVRAAARLKAAGII